MKKRKELEEEIVLRKNALKFCKQENLKDVLKDNLIKVQEELIELIKTEKKQKDER